ncbi:MAG: RNA polymerase sigma factor [Alicyclobacillus sp.]|nr:RNA polymerase sigma factor [Alicyclobacillus sp.]
MLSLDALQSQAWIREHWPRVWAYAYSLTENPDAANDLAQDVFIQAWKQLDQLRDVAHLRAWLFMITKNRWRDLQKSAWHRRVLLVDDWATIDRWSSDAADEALRQIERDSLWRAVLRLDRPDREILLLRAREDLAFADIALILQMREATVRSRYRRALRRLRVTLEKGGDVD